MKQSETIKKTPFRRLFEYIKPHKKVLVWSVLLTLASSLLIPFRPWLIRISIDDFIVKGDNVGLFILGIIFFVMLILQAFFQFWATYLTQLLGQRAILNLRMDIFKHLQRLSLSFFDKNPIGRLITITTSDVETLNEMLSSGVVALMGNIVQIAFISLLIVIIDWRLTLVMLSVLPVMFYLTMVFKKKIQLTYQAVRREVARLNAYLQEHITGMAAIQIFNRQESEFRKHDEINKAHRDANIRSVLFYSIFYPTIEFLSAIALALIIWYSTESLSLGMVTIGTVISFIQYVGMFFQPLQDLSDKYNTLQSASASGERIFSLLDENGIIHDPMISTSLNHVQGFIEFRNVNFFYIDRNVSVLENISFEVKAGEVVAFVGATGSGKSTIINLLSKLYELPTGSDITIDGIRLVNLSEKEIRKNVGVVLQDVFLFSGTIRENVTLGNESIQQDIIEETAKLIGIHSFIEKLHGGYNYQVTERGACLSAGQKQLIALLRVMLYNPKILALDEATSNVDSETEEKIERALDVIMKGRTTLIVAHRLSTIEQADKIILLHKGKIKGIGSHRELLAEGGLYQKFYKLQYASDKLPYRFENRLKKYQANERISERRMDVPSGK